MKPTNVLSNIFTYFDRATIGVLKYISRRSISKFERMFWVFCIAATLVSSIFLINQAIDKFMARKITIKLSDERLSVSEVPFPSISICPEVMMSQSDFLTIFPKTNRNIE
jgi:acid-sensing ion channel, other